MCAPPAYMQHTSYRVCVITAATHTSPDMCSSLLLNPEQNSLPKRRFPQRISYKEENFPREYYPEKKISPKNISSENIPKKNIFPEKSIPLKNIPQRIFPLEKNIPPDID